MEARERVYLCLERQHRAGDHLGFDISVNNRAMIIFNKHIIYVDFI